MKKKVFSYLILVFLILSIAPAINFYSGVKKLKVKYIYNVDFIIPTINSFLYSYGLNIKPGQVIVGKQGWLYLGDDYENVVSLARDGIDSSYIKSAIVKNNTLHGWERFFISEGVKDFKVLVGPNKLSIYPEFLPDWIKISESKKIDILQSVNNDEYYIYPQSIFTSAKKLYEGHDLYYKTDTHWNDFGAWVAFDYFMKEIKIKNPELNYNQTVLLKKSIEINGGDLAGFLRLTGSLKDREQVLEILPYSKVKIDCQRFYTNEKINCNNNAKIISQQEPLLVISKGSQNDKKVLWLRDSFGTALSPYMASVFSNVIQIHYGNLNKEKLINIVEEFKPDYVFMTIVERSIDGGLPTGYPEIQLDKYDTHSYASEYIASNDLEKEGGSFSISGRDPFLIYKLEHKVNSEFNDTVAISLTCDSDKKENVNVQLFWKKDENDAFSEVNSVRRSISQGISYIEPNLNPSWSAGEDVQYLRLDIESSSTNKCAKFNIKNLVFNKNL